jgi:hypothetical protein
VSPADPDFFPSIPAAVPEARVWKRLGRRRNTEFPGGEQGKAIRDALGEAFSLMDLRGAGLVVPILSLDPSEIRLAGGTVFRSAGLARLLRAATPSFSWAPRGREIMDASGRRRRGPDGPRLRPGRRGERGRRRALDWITGFYRRRLLREMKTVTKRRFSAGYGDFALENQEAIHRLLGLARLSVELTESFMLLPEKSVTAVAGILKIENRETSSDETEKSHS